MIDKFEFYIRLIINESSNFYLISEANNLIEIKNEDLSFSFNPFIKKASALPSFPKILYSFTFIFGLSFILNKNKLSLSFESIKLCLSDAFNFSHKYIHLDIIFLKIEYFSKTWIEGSINNI